MAWTHIPSPFEKARRLEWYQDQAADDLALATPLPWEICRQIIGYCYDDDTFRRFAIRSVKAIPRNQPSLRITEVSLSSQIWAEHRFFEGTEYIASLSNRPSQAHRTKLFDPVSEKGKDTLHIATDHLGVRRLLFANSVHNLEEYGIEQQDSTWWTSIHIPPTKDKLRVWRDECPPPQAAFYCYQY